jgi:hypothetical protein
LVEDVETVINGIQAHQILVQDEDEQISSYNSNRPMINFHHNADQFHET